MRRRVDNSRLIEHRARVRADLDPYLRREPRPSDPREVVVVPADTGPGRRAVRTLYRWLSGRGTPDRLQLGVSDLHDDGVECFWELDGEIRLRGRTAIETPIGHGDYWAATARIPYERIRRAHLTGRDGDGPPCLEVAYGVTGPFTGWAVLDHEDDRLVPVRTLVPRPRSERAFAWWLSRQRRRRGLAPSQRVARDLDRYLAAPGDEAAAGDLLDSVSSLLEDLLEDGPGWGDPDHCWLDGIHPASMEATGRDAALITGHAWVGELAAGSFRLRPVHAELRRRPAISHIFMASIEHEVAYDVSVLDEATGGRWPSRVTDRMVVPPDPVNWPHAHAIVLPPTPRPPRGPWWWTGQTRASSGSGMRLRGRLPALPGH